MFKFFDNDFLIFNDKKRFLEDTKSKTVTLILSKTDKSIEFKFCKLENKTPFYVLTLTEDDIPEHKILNLLIKNNALYWQGEPEYNPDIEIREMDDFMWKLLQIMDYTNTDMCPRIQLYRHGDTVLCRPHIYTLYDEKLNYTATTTGFNALVKKLNPEAKTENNFAKEDLSREVTPLNSLSYLEAQVDILTKVVLTLTEQNAKYKQLIAEKLPGVDKFLEEVEKHSVVNIKSIDDCTKEIASNKYRMRELQKDYYRKKV